MGVDMIPRLKEISFSLGISIASIIIGYNMVTGKWKSCLDIYHILSNKSGV